MVELAMWCAPSYFPPSSSIGTHGRHDGWLQRQVASAYRQRYQLLVKLHRDHSILRLIFGIVCRLVFSACRVLI